MPYYVVEDFRRGLDLRRSIDTSPAGTLRVLKNGFINDGGEIEKARAFVREETVTAAIQGIANQRDLPVGPLNAPRRDTVVLVSDADSPFAGGSQALFGGQLVSGAPAVQWARADGIADPADTAPPELNGGAVFSEGVYVSLSYEANLPGERTLHAFGDIPTDGSQAALALIAGRQEKVIHAHKQKMYAGKGPTLSFSGLLAPTDYTAAAVGSGALSVRTQGYNIGDIIALEDYYEQLAVFGTNGVQFWFMDPDPDQNQFNRALTNVSLIDRLGATGYSDGDIIAVTSNGVRSLRARDSSNQAAVTDIGSPIDVLTRTRFRPRDYTSVDPTRVPLLRTQVVPGTGQLLVYGRDWGREEAEGNGPFYRMFMLSRYPAADVLAWSELDTPAQPLSNIAQIQDTVCYMTVDGQFFVYGGVSEEDYDQTECEVVTPFMDFGRPGTSKTMQALDLACVGEWSIDVAFDPHVDPADPDNMDNIAWQHVAIVQNSTHRRGDIPLDGVGEHIAFRFRTSSPSRARLGQFLVHYTSGEEG